MSPNPFLAYLSAIQKELQAGNATEQTHRPALKALIEALDRDVTATNEPRRVTCGAPDFVITLRSPHSPLTVGYLETKDIGTNLGGIEADSERSNPSTRDGRQLSRYRAGICNLILTNYLEFRWYVNGALRMTAALGHIDSRNRIITDGAGFEEVAQLLQGFLEYRAKAIRSPKELAERMARLTRLISDGVVGAFEAGAASDQLRDLYKAFAEVLIPDLTVKQFADMFAQTLTYGLFAARINHKSEAGTFRRHSAAYEIPRANPFLRRLFSTIAGPELDDEPFSDFVDDLVWLLDSTDVSMTLAPPTDHGHREDPIIHFYETFLAAYDPDLRERRGVYYTPLPVVSYIVRSVDYLLRKHFDCEDGLADAGSVTYVVNEGKGKTRSEHSPRVLVLDPACGTGTFLYAVVDLIRNRFMARRDAGKWSSYVHSHLLHKLFGFELLMAPYAVAHLKLSMQLAGKDLSAETRRDWAYDFSGDERLGIYLTNTLEEALKRSELLIGRYISEEANAAVKVKRDLPIMVVLGNPPYSSSSANRGQWITKLMEDYKRTVRHKATQIQALSDDYVKFIRFAQWRIERTGRGIVAFITNNNYIDGLNFSDMRKALLDCFDEVYILNLHGNARRRERTPDGREDQNVFDIRQGVAILLLVRLGNGPRSRKAYYADLFGTRAEKYQFLCEHEVSDTDWIELSPSRPEFLFCPVEQAMSAEYRRWLSIEQCFGTGVPRVDRKKKYGTGFKTQQDDFAIAFRPDEFDRRVADLLSPANSEESLRQRYRLCRTDQWDFERARTTLRKTGWRSHITRCLYRPLDWRYTIYIREVVTNPRIGIMRHLMKPNLALCVGHAGQVVDMEWNLVACTNCPTDQNLFYRGGNMDFPLYLYHDVPDALNSLFTAASSSDATERTHNLSRLSIEKIETSLHLRFLSDGYGDLKTTFGPEDVFHYIYAILHSPTYRERYGEFLKTNYPRIPFTTNLRLFSILVRQGAQLTALHLLESPVLNKPVTQYPIVGDNIVEAGCPRYFPPGTPHPVTGEPLETGRVYISKDDPKTLKRGQYFHGIPPEVWDFHIGGYRVCEKWLKDRRGRVLTSEDIEHYERIIVAISETIRLMKEIDEVIEEHGGWPIR